MKKIEISMETVVEVFLKDEATEEEILEFTQNYKKSVVETKEAQALKSINLYFELIEE